MADRNGNLCLTRRPRESITLTLGGSVVVVTVTAVDRNKVHIQVSAPLEVKVMRTEILEQGRDSSEEKTK